MNAVRRATSTSAARRSRKTAWSSSCAASGSIKSAADLEQIVLAEAAEGTPIYLRDVATRARSAAISAAARSMSNGREVVGGIVVMRTGENAHAVIERVKEKIAQITPSLPPGVTIRPFYDRSELIDRTIDTLKHALTEEIILVTLAHIIFLFHFRSILIVTLPLPVSILDFLHPDEAVRHHLATSCR